MRELSTIFGTRFPHCFHVLRYSQFTVVELRSSYWLMLRPLFLSIKSNAPQGRSPYDEDIVSPDKRARGQSATQATQLYDEKGRPSNPEAKQYMKDQIRASNEIMQVAGVAVEKDDLYLKDEDEAGNLPIDNFQRGYFRLGFGRMLLSDSVWGVTGLRRRILVSNQHWKY